MIDAKYDDYRGKKRFLVQHPDHPPMTVAAPDENTALVAAAKKAGVRWQSYRFYAWATVTPVTEVD